MCAFTIDYCVCLVLTANIREYGWTLDDANGCVRGSTQNNATVICELYIFFIHPVFIVCICCYRFSET